VEALGRTQIFATLSPFLPFLPVFTGYVVMTRKAVDGKIIEADGPEGASIELCGLLCSLNFFKNAPVGDESIPPPKAHMALIHIIGRSRQQPTSDADIFRTRLPCFYTLALPSFRS